MNVLNLKKKEIIFSIAITIFIIFISAIVLYLVEGEHQPEAFGSILRSFWWATITLTTIGYGDQEEYSPLTAEEIQQCKESTVVFDIIYQPVDTLFQQIARENSKKTMGGLLMNLEQAVLAFNYANYQANSEVVTREAMHKS